MQCYKHPKVDTGLSCGKCERPICTKCMIVGPAGVRCRECASLRGSHLYKVHPARLALSAVVALVVGLAGSAVLFWVGYFVIFLGPVYGGLMAEAVIAASGRKRGTALTALAVGGIVVGALFSLWMTHLMFGSLTMVWRLLGVGLAISACYARMRYL